MKEPDHNAVTAVKILYHSKREQISYATLFQNWYILKQQYQSYSFWHHAARSLRFLYSGRTVLVQELVRLNTGALQATLGFKCLHGWRLYTSRDMLQDLIKITMKPDLRSCSSNSQMTATPISTCFLLLRNWHTCTAHEQGLPASPTQW